MGRVSSHCGCCGVEGLIGVYAAAVTDLSPPPTATAGIMMASTGRHLERDHIDSSPWSGIDTTTTTLYHSTRDNAYTNKMGRTQPVSLHAPASRVVCPTRNPLRQAGPDRAAIVG